MAHAILNSVGQTIRTIRNGRGLSQEEVAAAAGLNRVYYNRVERGTQNASLLTLAKIARVLETNVATMVADLPPFEGERTK